MSCQSVQTGVAGELCAINRELAKLLQTDPCPLSFGAERALKDDLVLCGILGGKDVGKSTLINALAQTDVSVDSEEVGKGTSRPMVFVHEDVESTARQRLQEISRDIPLDLCPHRADSIRNVVLIDMPDFDSDYADHLSIVKRVTPLLDRVLWVQTPRKVADRLWVKTYHDVLKDAQNVHFVLNKVDELLSDGDPFASADPSGQTDGNGRGRTRKDSRKSDNGRAESFWQEQDRWFAQSLEAAGAPTSADHRFLISAAFPSPGEFVARIAQRWDDPDWTQYAGDRGAVEHCAQFVEGDIVRLRQTVLSGISAEQAHNLKAANQAREHQAAVARIKKHFVMDRIREDLAQACDPVYVRQVLEESMGRGYCAGVGSVLALRLRSAKRLADVLLERRVEDWPLLRLIHWPLGWLSRLLSRHRAVPAAESLAPSSGSVSRGLKPAARGEAVTMPTARGEVGITPAFCGEADTALARRPLDIGGRPFTGRIDGLRARILADHAGVAGQLGMESHMPSATDLAAQAAARVAALPAGLETRIVDDIRAADRRPSRLGKAGLWLILLWFPLLQPILEGVLEVYVETGAWHNAHGVYRIVSALSAPQLLAGLLIVSAIYVALVAGMYTRALRAVQGSQDDHDLMDRLRDAVDDVLVDEVALPLLGPFRECLDRMTALQDRLELGLASEVPLDR